MTAAIAIAAGAWGLAVGLAVGLTVAALVAALAANGWRAGYTELARKVRSAERQADRDLDAAHTGHAPDNDAALRALRDLAAGIRDDKEER